MIETSRTATEKTKKPQMPSTFAKKEPRQRRRQHRHRPAAPGGGGVAKPMRRVSLKRLRQGGIASPQSVADLDHRHRCSRGHPTLPRCRQSQHRHRGTAVVTSVLAMEASMAETAVVVRKLQTTDAAIAVDAAG